MITKRKRKPFIQENAIGQYIRMSPHKARRIIDQIRDCSYEDALMILDFMPYRARHPIIKLVYSAASNGNHNKDFDKTSLVISKAEVNEGTTIKRLKPRARGRSYLIKRPTCHITIVVTTLDEYEFRPFWYQEPRRKKFIFF
uniref:ribosomal protein L22 n=1 Tax=Phyllanthus acidus TaxID=260718 RepID=UPI0022FD5BC8|nr:ribosomal protein L22 [Cicca acida]WAX37393.1 ribosomal protein L22 [Cicca acida]WJJ69811.1 ribosomal protein L22 [Cicca acida]